jgi:hypothetical protein
VRGGIKIKIQKCAFFSFFKRNKATKIGGGTYISFQLVIVFFQDEKQMFYCSTAD